MGVENRAIDDSKRNDSPEISMQCDMYNGTILQQPWGNREVSTRGDKKILERYTLYTAVTFICDVLTCKTVGNFMLLYSM